jgi:hypothetical protein
MESQNDSTRQLIKVVFLEKKVPWFQRKTSPFGDVFFVPVQLHFREIVPAEIVKVLGYNVFVLNDV